MIGKYAMVTRLKIYKTIVLSTIYYNAWSMEQYRDHKSPGL